MPDVFVLRESLARDCASFVSGFINIRDPKIREYVEGEFASGTLWPQPLVQLNPSFQRGESVDELVAQRLLHQGCASVFCRKQDLHDRGQWTSGKEHNAKSIRQHQQEFATSAQ